MLAKSFILGADNLNAINEIIEKIESGNLVLDYTLNPERSLYKSETAEMLKLAKLGRLAIEVDVCDNDFNTTPYCCNCREYNFCQKRSELLVID